MTALLNRVMPDAIKQQIKRCIPAYSKCYCPLCGRYESEFRTFGLVPRQDAKCPNCGALERHRLVWQFLRTETDLFDGRPRRMLHVAAEPSLSVRLRKLRNLDYVTADLLNPKASVQLDITDMPTVASDSFDVLYCSHVLEHVSDDRKAMRECARVLKPDGWAVLLVPITTSKTFEDPSVTDPQERERLFGKDDHVRRYGSDFAERLQDAGFLVRTYSAMDVLGKRLARYAVPADEGPIYFCRLRA